MEFVNSSSEVIKSTELELIADKNIINKDNNMNSLLLNHDIEHVLKMSKLAYDDTNLEFEAKVKSNNITSDQFKNVRELCRTKACNSTWKCIKDRDKTLDITIDETFRITINGLFYIQEYFRSNSLYSLPENSWYVMQKKPYELYKKGYPLDDIGIKLNLKEEIHLEKNNEIVVRMLQNWNQINKYFRLKNRYSYLVDEIYCIDLTVVKSGNTTQTIIESQIHEEKNNEKYEIELEYIPNIIINKKQKFNLEKWFVILNNIFCTLNNTRVSTSISELKTIEKEYYSLISKKNIDIVYDKIKKSYKLSPNVVTLTLDKLNNLIDNKHQYYVTPKSDGLRMSGFIDKNGKLFLFGKHSQYFEYTGVIFKPECKNSIFDGELITKTKDNVEIYHYLIFDCYYNKGIDIRYEGLPVRRNICSDLLDNNIIKYENLSNNIKCQVILKEFVHLITGTFAEKCRYCFELISDSQYENDGLIFTPSDAVGGDELYENQRNTPNKFIKSGINFDRLYKWKDSKFNSIDFRIKFISTFEIPILINNDYVLQKYQKCVLYIGCPEGKLPIYTRKNFLQDITNPVKSYQKNKSNNKNENENEFQPIEPFDENACYVSLPIIDGKIRCKVNSRWEGNTINNDDIVEMIYDLNESSDKKWIPIRIRKDKDTPNFIDNALDVWRSIHLPITENMLTGNEDIPDIVSISENDKYYNVTDRTDNNLRKFHRVYVKKLLFANTVGIINNNTNISPRLLDIGSGKGGDISRYIENNATVIGVDSAIDNLHNPIDGAYKRLTKIYNNHKKRKNNIPKDKIIFIAGDGGKLFTDSNTFISNNDDYYKQFVTENTIFENKHTFDTVSVFFAIHYFFKSKQIFNNFIQNIADNVKIGGYFVGCCYDGDIIHKLFEKQLEENDNNILTFRKTNGDIILEIEKNYTGILDDTDKSFGKEINVIVQSINKKHPEYLVNFTLLSKELFKIGFIMTESNNFEYYYNSDPSNLENYPLDPEEKNASFLNRTFIFKRISYEPTKIDLN